MACTVQVLVVPGGTIPVQVVNVPSTKVLYGEYFPLDCRYSPSGTQFAGRNLDAVKINVFISDILYHRKK
jgi:hypothetical protein